MFLLDRRNEFDSGCIGDRGHDGESHLMYLTSDLCKYVSFYHTYPWPFLYSFICDGLKINQVFQDSIRQNRWLHFKTRFSKILMPFPLRPGIKALFWAEAEISPLDIWGFSMRLITWPSHRRYLINVCCRWWNTCFQFSKLLRRNFSSQN